MELTIGCTTRPYSAWSFAEACNHIAVAGFTDVGFVPVRADSRAEEITATRKTAAEAGLAPSMVIGKTQLGLGLEAAVDDYKRLIDNAAEVGAKWLLDCGTSRDKSETYFELMRGVSIHAEKAGVGLTLKPHGGITLTIDDLLDAFDKVSHPAFGICYDPGNIIYYTKGELHPAPDIARIAPIVTTGIIKDCLVTDSVPDVMVTPGEGLVDFEKVLGGLIEGSFRGPLYVECVAGKKLDEINKNVKSSRKFIGDILAKL